MSLYGAMFSGVSGLAAQSSALSAISDNISNVNTTGYKGTDTKFSTLVTKQVASSQYSPGGVQAAPRARVDVQGLLNGTNSATDIAISGQGFFVVNQAANPSAGDMWAYSRAGSFKIDNEGYLVNTGGYYLQAWPTNNNGDLGYYNSSGDFVSVNPNIVSEDNLRPINLSTISGTAAATRNIVLGLNLPKGSDVGDSVDTDMQIHDSMGGAAALQFNWTKTGMNNWEVAAVPPPGAATLALYDSTDKVYAATGRIDFSSVPSATETLDIGGTTYTFVNGTPANATEISLTLPIAATTATISQRLVDAVNLQNNGALGAAAFAGNAAAGDILDIGVTPVSIGGMNLDGIVGAINNVASTTGVKAVNVGGKLGLYNTTGAAVSVTNNTGTPLTAIMGGVPPALNPGLNSGQRFVADGAAVEITQTKTGGLIDIEISPTATWSPQAYTHVNTATQGTFTVQAVGTGATVGVVFNTDGTPQTITPQKLGVEWANGSADMVNGITDRRITLDLGTPGTADRGLQQLDGEYTPKKISEDGAAFGNFAGVTISKDGTVMALFDNGENRRIAKVAIATFTNPNGLQSLSGNAWIETEGSGKYTLRAAGHAGAGEVNAAALEGSTVDLGEEFTNMIVTQRAYSASAKVITTADEMLDELIRIKR